MINGLGALRILGKRFTLHEVEKSEFDADLYGRINHRQGTIHVLADLPEEQKADTVIHECLHALEYAMGLDMKEETVHALAAGIYALFADNPKLYPALFPATVAVTLDGEATCVVGAGRVPYQEVSPFAALNRRRATNVVDASRKFFDAAMNRPI